ncbi:unnamed protein product [Durusdinium trenchii]|uniref:Uncharacterized protein n=1 Tax=Durusdinium trenchii TaxID=1381693 RepID=A0ABP0S052_9DINO
MVSPPSSSRGVAPPSASPPRRARFEDEDRGRVGSLDARESSRTRISSRPPDDSRARKLSVTAPRRLLSSSGSLDLSPRSSEATALSFAATAQLFDSGLQHSLLSPSPSRDGGRADSDYSDDFEPAGPRVPRAPTPPRRSGVQRSPTPPRSAMKSAHVRSPTPPAGSRTAPAAPKTPSAPSVPLKPALASKPVAPAAPAAPQAPVGVRAPATPAAPAAPQAPVVRAPSTPAAPAAPQAPVSVRAPSTPVSPAAPQAPVVRASTPAAPAAPQAPVSVRAPSTPVAPAAPQAPVIRAPSTPAAPAAPPVRSPSPTMPAVPTTPVAVSPPTAPIAPQVAVPAPVAPQAPVVVRTPAPSAPPQPVPAPAAAGSVAPPIAPVQAVPVAPTAPVAPTSGDPIAPTAPLPPPPPAPPPPPEVVEARKDDATLQKMLGDLSPSRARTPRTPRTPRRSRGRPSPRARSPGHSEGRRVQVLVQHRTDLCAPICDALALPDLVLESDVTVAGVRLRRGMQLVVPKNASVLAKSLTRSRQKLLMGLKTMRSLVFMWPEYMDEEPDFMTWWWKCPACRFPYPVQAPEALSGVSLLRRALPGVDNFLDGPARDLWALSGLSLPAKPKQPHALREVNNRFGDVTAQCSCCGQQVGTSAYMCQLCGLFVCPVCEKRSRMDHTALCCPPGPAEGKAGVLYQKLSNSLEERFDLSSVLDFGSIDRFLAQPTAAEAVQRLLKRTAGRLERLKGPCEYYARAALLQGQARRSTAEERFHLLQEACVALQECMATGGSNVYNLYKIESGGNSKTPMEKDPRVWYLLGLVLCDLGSFEEARKVYRQALCRLPMYYFSHVVHFNLALLRARDADAAACCASAQQVVDLRRSCAALRAPRWPSFKDG